MKCPRCLNQDDQFFYYGSKGWYCRRCIKFQRQLVCDQFNHNIDYQIKDHADEYLIKYELTSAQKLISAKCNQLITHNDVFIDAVCGAGKTELVVLTIARFLKNKQKVAFAIARRQVVLELAERLSIIFSKAKVIPVCQGYTKDLTGDLIICTTHQLYRYPKYFDLLILDEPDAFPYKNNLVLHGIVQSACKGRMIYLTATADKELKDKIKNKEIKHLILNRRPHNHPICEPHLIIAPKIIRAICLVHFILKHPKTIIFVPRISYISPLVFILNRFLKTAGISSKTLNKDQIITKFRNNEYRCLVATTILERGVTFAFVDVCILNADDPVFDLASLIQMSGRVGRSFKKPEGDCLFIARKKAKVVQECLDYCRKVNQREAYILEE